MKAKLKVLVPLRDKNDPKVHYKVGKTLITDDIDRINDLIARKVCVIVGFENDVPKPPSGIEVNGATYPVKTVKTALGAIGVAVDKTADAKAVTEVLGTLSAEQTAELAAALAEKKE